MTKKKTADMTKLQPLIDAALELSRVKSGYKTSELVPMVIKVVAGAAAMLLPLWLGMNSPYVVVAGAVVALMSGINFTNKRTEAKGDAIEAAASVLRSLNDNPQAIVANALPEAPQLESKPET